MNARTGQSVHQRKAAAELKRLRELALLTADEVAQHLGWSPSKVSRLENARIRLKQADVERLLTLYEVTGEQREKLISLANEDSRRKWWDVYADILPPDHLTLISFEAEASSALNYEPMVIPGLLQTPDYARRVIYMWHSITNVPPLEMERRLEARLARQRVISSSNPLKLSVIIDEAVLRRQIDECSVMWEQLHYLVEMSKLPNITLQILPLSGLHVISPGPFLFLRVPEFGEVVYLEDFTSGHLYVDSAALIYQHALVFEQLSTASHDPDESRRLIEKTARELWRPNED